MGNLYYDNSKHAWHYLTLCLCLSVCPSLSLSLSASLSLCLSPSLCLSHSLSLSVCLVLLISSTLSLSHFVPHFDGALERQLEMKISASHKSHYISDWNNRPYTLTLNNSLLSVFVLCSIYVVTDFLIFVNTFRTFQIQDRYNCNCRKTTVVFRCKM